jgi:hypothetical protein
MATNPNISEYIGVTPKSAFDLAEIVENGLPTDNLNNQLPQLAVPG